MLISNFKFVHFFIFLATLSISGCADKKDTNQKLVVGWQVPWALQGQLVQVLKNTDILKKNEVEADFKGFQFGPPLNEAALAGGINVVLTADQPAATLISKNPDWVIVSRLMYNRVALYVPPKSPVTTIKQLKGKIVGMPFGAAAQRFALKAQIQAGLIPDKDVKNINLSILEQSDLVKDSGSVKWGTIDALAGFDPTPAIFETKKLARILLTGKIVSVVLMKKSYIKKNPEIAINFIRSLRQSYSYYQANTSKADKWFTDEAKLALAPEALAIANSLEPNLSANTKTINLDFTEEDYKSLQEACDFLFNNKMIKNPIKIRDHIDLTFLQKASF